VPGTASPFTGPLPHRHQPFDHATRADRHSRGRCAARFSRSSASSKIEAESQRARIEYDLLVVPGLELTYNDLDPYLAAHAVAIGCRAFVSVERGVDAALAHARGEGAALVAAHPFRTSRASSPGRPARRRGAAPPADW
jgi:hypothetical protein